MPPPVRWNAGWEGGVPGIDQAAVCTAGHPDTHTPHPPLHPMRCAGFLSVYMRSECRKSCQLCILNSPAEAPKAPAVERPPEPACDKVPDAGSACPFFMSSLVVSHSGGGLVGP